MRINSGSAVNNLVRVIGREARGFKRALVGDAEDDAAAAAVAPAPAHDAPAAPAAAAPALAHHVGAPAAMA